MATVLKPDLKSLFVDKEEIRRILAEQDAISGFVEDPDATAQKARALIAEDLKAHGLRPEDNIASRAIIAARDE